MLYHFLLVLMLFSLLSCGGGEKNNTPTGIVDNIAPVVLSSLKSGTYSKSQVLAIRCDDGSGSGCDRIFFRLSEGLLSVDWMLYQQQLEIIKSTTVEFTAFDRAGNQSEIQKVELDITSEQITATTIAAENVGRKRVPPGTVRIQNPPRVRVSLPAGIYSSAMPIVLSCEAISNIACRIYYTLDGSRPTLGSKRITAPVFITRSQVLRYFAVDQLGNKSLPGYKFYLIDRQAPLLFVDENSGLFNSPVSVSLSCSDIAGSGCNKIYYTLNGQTPNIGSSIYVAPLLVNSDSVLQAVALDNAGNRSLLVKANYQFDFQSPVIISSLPENGATDFSSKEAILLNVSELLDTGTVNVANIKLLNQAGIEHAITVSLQQKIITVNLLQPLNKMETYSLFVSGVQDQSSNLMSDYRIDFSTSSEYLQVVKRSPELISPARIMALTYDANHIIATKRTYSQPGYDGIWFTADDMVSTYAKVVLNELQLPFRYITFDSPGADSVWGNADDQMQTYSQYEYLNGKLITRKYFDSPGVDNVWLTDDDGLLSVSVYEYDQAGVIVRSTLFADSGDDGIWLTADDRVVAYEQFSDAGLDGATIKKINYDNAGADNLWFTDDDIIKNYTLYTKDYLQNKISVQKMNSPGLDNIWFNKDDVVEETSVIDVPATESFNPLFYP